MRCSHPTLPGGDVKVCLLPVCFVPLSYDSTCWWNVAFEETVTLVTRPRPVNRKDHQIWAKQTLSNKDLLTIVKRLKLRWYGHVSRSSGLVSAILQGTVKGGRRQGGQKKRWEDNIMEWTGLEFGKSQRAVENRGKWRKLVTKSSVVPQ